MSPCYYRTCQVRIAQLLKVYPLEGFLTSLDGEVTVRRRGAPVRGVNRGGAGRTRAVNGGCAGRTRAAGRPAIGFAAGAAVGLRYVLLLIIYL